METTDFFRCRKHPVNPSFISAMKLPTLRLGNQRDGRGEHGSTADGALPGAGAAYRASGQAAKVWTEATGGARFLPYCRHRRWS